MLERPGSERSTKTGKGNKQTKYSYCITRHQAYDTNTTYANSINAPGAIDAYYTKLQNNYRR